jgi:hypothetical protein
VGLYRQPNEWTCGPFALKHALVTLGRLADEQTIASVANPHWWTGTDEVKLARAARHYDCDLPLIRRHDETRACNTLVRCMSQSRPVLLCVDDWSHWITVVRHEHSRFVVLDSRREPVVKVMSWPQLRSRWEYWDEEVDEEAPLFDLHVVKPRFRVPIKAQFSVERAQFLRRPENAFLALHWDDYLGDLMEICRPQSAQQHSALSMAEFLRRHQDLLVSRVRYWHGDVERMNARRVLRNFRFVAETYGLVIPASATRRAIVDMAMLLALWAAAAGGVDPMYGSDDISQRRLH